MFCYGKETSEEIVIVVFGLNKVTPSILKYIRDFFMDKKKSNFLKDRFELSSFILKIYNVNAGNCRYASVSSVRKGAKTH